MWIGTVNALDLLVKGIVVGVISSAPMGPVGILTVQRTLKKGRRYGFVTGLGAAVSDLFYALATGLGMSFVLDFIEKPTTMLYLKILGGIVLFLFGLHLYRSKMAPLHKASGRMGSLTHNALTGFLLTLSNPLIVFLFMALFARFDFVAPDHAWEMSFGYLGILLGALAWWFSLTRAVKTMNNHFDLETVNVLNRLLGLLVMVASTVGMIYTIFR